MDLDARHGKCAPNRLGRRELDSAASANASKVARAIADSTAGAAPRPIREMAKLIAAGITAPPNIEPGKSHEVARASPGKSLASQAMPVGKIGANARPVTTYANGAASPDMQANSASAPSAAPVITIAYSGTREGTRPTIRRPSPRANQKPEVTAAAEAGPLPNDLR